MLSISFLSYEVKFIQINLSIFEFLGLLYVKLILYGNRWNHLREWHHSTFQKIPWVLMAGPTSLRTRFSVVKLINVNDVIALAPSTSMLLTAKLGCSRLDNADDIAISIGTKAIASSSKLTNLTTLNFAHNSARNVLNQSQNHPY